jgi:predicted sulfurtransferase
MNRSTVPITTASLAALALGALLLACQTAPTPSRAPTPEAERISKEELRKMLDDPRLVVIDTRVKQQWDKAEFKIPGARHGSPWTAEEWGQDIPRDRIVVTYCS